MLTPVIHAIRRALPAACIVCGQAAYKEYSICDVCEPLLPRLGECCRRCGIEFGAALSKDRFCNSCLLRPPSFAMCCAAFPYVPPISKLVANFKFSAGFDIGYSLSRILARDFNAHYGTAERPQLLLPVPLHSKRLSSRGFNQAREISRVLSRHCRVATSDSMLLKTRHTEAQTSMKSATARKTNLRGAFSLRKVPNMEAVTHIALVDDVVTTMATMETLSRLLRSQLGCRVDVWCLARANR
ncbi:MAG: double zinc ribbon domain-containing protein [Pseudohongiellaceae bacterium]